MARWAPRAALAVGLVVLTTGCTNAWENLGLRAPVTKQGELTLGLWQGSWIAAFAVGFIVWGLILWTVIFHRKRSNRIPHQVRYNLPIEILYTVIPFIMVGTLFFFTARDEDSIDALSKHPQVIVDVTGFQWSWQFQYPQYKVPRSRWGNVTELGQTWNGVIPGNKNQLPLLVIPDHETVRFNLVSTDVVHAFYIAELDFRRDVIPGHPNHFQITATKTAAIQIGRCTELCGLYHSRMLFRVKIVTPAQFRTWVLAQQKSQNAAGSPLP
jgi:cytochrome c oxidase subunit 2